MRLRCLLEQNAIRKPIKGMMGALPSVRVLSPRFGAVGRLKQNVVRNVARWVSTAAPAPVFHTVNEKERDAVGWA